MHGDGWRTCSARWVGSAAAAPVPIAPSLAIIDPQACRDKSQPRANSNGAVEDAGRSPRARIRTT